MKRDQKLNKRESQSSEKTTFMLDKAIESKADDLLNREGFSSHLGESLLSWTEKESLVIALYGEWGSGKSSVINLAKEHINDNSEKCTKPTIIEFNPWFFSDLDNLSQYFFNELAKELELKKDDEKDRKIAKKLKLYAKLLQVIPEKKILSDLSAKIFLGLGLFSISTSQIIQWINLSPEWLTYIAFGIGALLFFLGIFKDALLGLSDFFSQKGLINKMPLAELKKEIKQHLRERGKKLIIVIDDIDRLDKSEIRQVFRLIRINADFPNTIYLLAFDRQIIEEHLEEQFGALGKDYLKKIVQVSFDIPLANSEKIAGFLSQELERIIGALSFSQNEPFDERHFETMYQSGFKSLFENIRDVKRFASSLQFNISQMHQRDIMEVNLVDFIAIEAIRLFAPDLYSFMKSRKIIFTATSLSQSSGDGLEQTRRAEIEKQIENGLNANIKKNIKRLIYHLFPNNNGNDTRLRRRELRVCVSEYFDSYFTLTPAGDEGELSQYEIRMILSSMENVKNFERVLVEYIDNNKLGKILERIQDYTSDLKEIPPTNVQNVVQAFFNVSDDLSPMKRTGIFGLGLRRTMHSIIFQLFTRELDQNSNYEIFKNTIPQSAGVILPMRIILEETRTGDEERSRYTAILPKDKLSELKRLCVAKIKKLEKERLLSDEDFMLVLDGLKTWGEEADLQEFISAVTNDEWLFWLFIKSFISQLGRLLKDRSGEIINSNEVKHSVKVAKEGLETFVSLDKVENRIEAAKKDSELYHAHKEIIDSFSTYY